MRGLSAAETVNEGIRALPLELTQTAMPQRSVSPMAAALFVFLLFYVSDAWIWPTSSANNGTAHKLFGIPLHVAFALCVFAGLTVYQRKTIAGLWHSRLFLSLVVLAFISSILSGISVEGLELLWWFFGTVVLAALLAELLPPNRALHLYATWALFVSVASIALFLLAPRLGAMPIQDGGLRGLFDHKNIFGSFVVSSFPVLLHQAQFGESQRERRVGWGALLTCTVGLVLSQSGTGLLVSSAEVVCWFVFPRLAALSNKRNGGLMAAILVAVALGWLFSVGVDTVAEVVGKSNTLAARELVWRTAFAYRPPSLLGEGFGSLSYDSEPMRLVHLILRQPLRSAHSMYVQVLYEQGYVGLVMYCVALVIGLSKGLFGRARPFYPFLLLLSVTAASVIVYGFVESRNGFRMSQSVLLLAMGLAWAHQRRLGAEASFNRAGTRADAVMRASSAQ